LGKGKRRWGRGNREGKKKKERILNFEKII
jgi:hypothetical protein